MSFKRFLAPLSPLKPWLTLSLAVPALLVVNTAFVVLFPANEAIRTSVLEAANPFSTPNMVAQNAYVYQNRTPKETWGDFHYMMGAQLASRGQMIAAEGLLLKAAQFKPADANVQITYGIVLEALEKLEPAKAAYLQAIEADKDSVDGLYRLGMLYDRMGNIPKGVEILHDALKIEPDNAYLNYDIGVLYAKQDDYNNSALYSRLAAEANQEFAEAFNNYGYALANLGKYSEALTAAEKSLEIKPDSAASLDTRGFALQGLKRYEEALDDYNKALELDSNIGEIYFHKAQVLEALSRYEESLKTYTRYLQLDAKAPNRTEVEATIERLKIKTGKASSEANDKSGETVQ